jgi:hypothetical protein
VVTHPITTEKTTFSAFLKQKTIITFHSPFLAQR